jgi:hypothetical protein
MPALGLAVIHERRAGGEPIMASRGRRRVLLSNHGGSRGRPRGLRISSLSSRL